MMSISSSTAHGENLTHSQVLYSSFPYCCLICHLLRSSSHSWSLISSAFWSLSVHLHLDPGTIPRIFLIISILLVVLREGRYGTAYRDLTNMWTVTHGEELKYAEHFAEWKPNRKTLLILWVFSFMFGPQCFQKKNLFKLNWNDKSFWDGRKYVVWESNRELSCWPFTDNEYEVKIEINHYCLLNW